MRPYTTLLLPPSENTLREAFIKSPSPKTPNPPHVLRSSGSEYLREVAALRDEVRIRGDPAPGTALCSVCGVEDL